ncbi:MAG: hypothetical protein M3Q64_00165 [bacterium]|nr:hypothetical protein [bacterium]
MNIQSSKQAITFANMLFDNEVSQSQTRDRFKIPYLIIKQDFSPEALEIPYFVGIEKLTKLVFISEQIPECFRDICVRHERACNGFFKQDCAIVTNGEIELLRSMHFTKRLQKKFEVEDNLFEQFLNMRIAMFEGLLKTQHGHAKYTEMECSLEILQTWLETTHAV